MKLALGKIDASKKEENSFDTESDIYEDVVVSVQFENGKSRDMKLTSGDTIQNIKKILHDEEGHTYEVLNMYWKEKELFNPMSLNDYPGFVQDGKATITVKASK
eukprot:TRINITY_DN13182_c0_g1_i1.p1 TRINITY_DN13182_c0_g1~~TRINITY_DN13182_c0_g1_i1.p1  ORF type:complete len:104 (+),score=45.64 TRINITY_DN13182_c0_g1_i1:88-399(+)